MPQPEPGAARVAAPLDRLFLHDGCSRLPRLAEFRPFATALSVTTLCAACPELALHGAFAPIELVPRAVVTRLPVGESSTPRLPPPRDHGMQKEISQSTSTCTPKQLFWLFLSSGSGGLATHNANQPLLSGSALVGAGGFQSVAGTGRVTLSPDGSRAADDRISIAEAFLRRSRHAIRI